MPKKGYKQSIKHKENLSKSHKGKKFSEEHKKKLSNKIVSEETKKKMSIAKSKEKHPMWKGGCATGKNRKKYQSQKNKEWIKANRDYKNYLTGEKRVKKLKAEGSHTWGEWELLKKQYGFMCPCCGKSEPEIKLTQDHIIPLSRGGSDYIENIQPLCMHCNSVKHTDIIKFNL